MAMDDPLPPGAPRSGSTPTPTPRWPSQPAAQLWARIVCKSTYPRRLPLSNSFKHIPPNLLNFQPSPNLQDAFSIPSIAYEQSRTCWISIEFIVIPSGLNIFHHFGKSELSKGGVDGIHFPL
jgi:hypothetical protein